jgi:hypothetical protein
MGLLSYVPPELLQMILCTSLHSTPLHSIVGDRVTKHLMFAFMGMVENWKASQSPGPTCLMLFSIHLSFHTGKKIC